MKKIFVFILPIIIIGCAGDATVEIGINDQGLLRGTLPNLMLWVSKIEFPEDNTYTTVWEGSKEVQVAINDDTFLSIADDYIAIPGGSYQHIRLTIDSLYFVQDNTSGMLLDTAYQFDATALFEIIIEEGDEFQLLVNIISDNWFDADSLRIKPGHEAFEGARLLIYYQ